MMTSSKIKEIVQKRKQSIARDVAYKKLLNQESFREDRITLSEAIKENSGVSIISEIKPASPTLGEIRSNLKVEELARTMEFAGSVGLSVLTEPNYFQGSYENLKTAIKTTSIPCLMKDFLVDPVQCSIAKQLGATNLLIINSIGGQNLESNYRMVTEAGLEPLIEIHDIEEIRDIRHLHEMGLHPKLVGVNNRNLRTLKINLNTSKIIIPKLKQEFGESIQVISESGIHTHHDIKEMLHHGADAFLIGSSIMEADDVGTKIRELRGEK